MKTGDPVSNIAITYIINNKGELKINPITEKIKSNVRINL